MLDIQVDKGQLAIRGINSQSEEETVNDLFSITYSVLMFLSIKGVGTKEQACLNYGTYARILTDFIEDSIYTVDENFKET